MTDRSPTPVPVEVVQLVESHVRKELADVGRYDNREPYDESYIFSLHQLAAKIYGLGFAQGECIEAERARNTERRQREHDKKACL